MFEDFNDIVTVREMRQMLRLGRSKAYELIREGAIGCIRIGDRILIPKKNVIQFVEASLAPAPNQDLT